MGNSLHCISFEIIIILNKKAYIKEEKSLINKKIKKDKKSVAIIKTLWYNNKVVNEGNNKMKNKKVSEKKCWQTKNDMI